METTVLVEHRVSAMHWMALVKGGVDVVSVYLKSGEGTSEANATILDSISDKILPLNRPFVVGGDWQMTTEELDSMGW
eukprot:12526566-Heterocapsa_arctica.AAC.1